jgi:hypothetical protein
MADNFEAGGSDGGIEGEIDDMFKHLELREDELDDVVGEEEVKEYKKAARCLAIRKVHTTRSFVDDAVFGKMKAIWDQSSMNDLVV